MHLAAQKVPDSKSHPLESHSSKNTVVLTSNRRPQHNPRKPQPSDQAKMHEEWSQQHMQDNGGVSSQSRPTENVMVERCWRLGCKTENYKFHHCNSVKENNQNKQSCYSNKRQAENKSITWMSAKKKQMNAQCNVGCSEQKRSQLFFQMK